MAENLPGISKTEVVQQNKLGRNTGNPEGREVYWQVSKCDLETKHKGCAGRILTWGSTVPRKLGW